MRDLKRLNTTLGDKVWWNFIDHAQCFYWDYNFPAHAAAILQACFVQYYHKAAIENMVALILAKLQ